MSTKGMTAASVEVDHFRAQWQAAARRSGVRAPLPSNWQTAFTAMVKGGKRTYQLVDLIPAAMRDGIDNRWAYYRAIVRNTR